MSLVGEFEERIVEQWFQNRQEQKEQKERLLEQQKGMLILILSLVEQRFGKISLKLQGQLIKLTAPQLQELGKQLLTLPSKKDLQAWLDDQKKRLHQADTTKS